MLTLTDVDVRLLLADIIEAEALPLPGFAKHHYVIARQISRQAQSPPPIWIALAIKALDYAIPLILDWLVAHYGDNWSKRVGQLLHYGGLPWPSSNHPPPSPASAAASAAPSSESTAAKS